MEIVCVNLRLCEMKKTNVFTELPTLFTALRNLRVQFHKAHYKLVEVMISSIQTLAWFLQSGTSCGLEEQS